LSPSLYRRLHFADNQRRDIDAYFIPTVSLCRWSTGRYFIPSLYRRLHFADNQRRNIDSFIIQVSLHRWSTARYWVLHYIDGFISPMINGEIWMPTLYRRFHFADDQRRDIESFIIQTVSLRQWSTARFPICIIWRIFNQTDCDIHMKKAVLYIETIT